RIRTDPALAAVYVILLTAGVGDDPGVYLGRGADDYLAKPYQPPALRAAVRVGLRTQAHRRILARRERRRAIEWLATVVAHELNNPLAAALSSVEVMSQLLDAPTPEALAELRQLLGETRGVLGRIALASKRLNTQEHVRVGGVGAVTCEALA